MRTLSHLFLYCAAAKSFDAESYSRQTIESRKEQPQNKKKTKKQKKKQDVRPPPQKKKKKQDVRAYQMEAEGSGWGLTSFFFSLFFFFFGLGVTEGRV